MTIVGEREHRGGGRAGGEVVHKPYFTSKHPMFSYSKIYLPSPTSPCPVEATFDFS